MFKVYKWGMKLINAEVKNLPYADINRIRFNGSFENEISGMAAPRLDKTYHIDLLNSIQHSDFYYEQELIMENSSLGILGTGHLASYTVAGLRNAGDDRNVFVSPRNREVAKALSEKHDCTIAADNQSVINQSEIVLLSVRPHQLSDLLTGLKFNTDQLIISAIAGVTIEQLKTYPQLSSNTIVRTLPSVSAEVNSGSVPLFPDDNNAHKLLKSLGTIIILENESSFDIATVHACTHGWVYFWLDEMIKWTIDQGINPHQAQIMIKQTVQGAIDFSNHQQDSLDGIGNSIATSGTYTLAGLEKLRCNHSLEDWATAMQLVLDKLKKD